MGSDPPKPEPSETPSGAEKIPPQYQARPRVFIFAFVIVSLLNLVLRSQVQPGATFASTVLNDVFASIICVGIFSLYLKAVRKLTWSAAAAYSTMLIGGMLAADIIRDVLLFR